MNQHVTLHNGVNMPIFGLGTWEMRDEAETIDVISSALSIGYRLIDTASCYHNEAWIGKALKNSGVARKDLFITTKLWTTEKTYETSITAFHKSLENLQTDYVDLYLIHFPKPQSRENWLAMEKIYSDGKAKAIGVSNFLIHHLEDFLPECQISPMVNQVEFHPFLQQPELLAYCRDKEIQVEAWAPLNKGLVGENPVITALAQKHNRTAAQVVLRWNIQQDIVTIPKTVTHARLLENADIFDFELPNEDMEQLAALDTNSRCGPDPDNNNF